MIKNDRYKTTPVGQERLRLMLELSGVVCSRYLA